jgi:phytoene dehydrogenase-like protein
VSPSAVVVGAGHNGLVAALRLARAGRTVIVLEQGDEPGGCVWTARHPSGVLVERGAFEHAGIRGLAADLGLADVGLRYREHPVVAGFLFGDGQRRVFHSDLDTTVAALGADGPAYRELAERGQALFGMLGAFPEPPTLTQVAAALAPLRGGDALFRTLLSPAETVIDTALADPHTRAALALQASHAQVPAWAPGTGMFAYLLPIAHGSPGVRPVGGSRELTDALVAAIEAAGGTVRTSATVAHFASAPGGGATVTLAGGEELTADVVVSTVGLLRTAALLTDEAPALRAAGRGLHSGHFNVSELTVTLVADTPFDLGLEDPNAVWYAVGDPADIRCGFGEILAGQLPSAPWSMLAEVAQPGGVTGGALWLSSVVPLHPADGPWTEARERAAGERLVDQVTKVLGRNLRGHLVDTVVAGPATWARRVGGDGSPNHLDNTVDQLLGWRPPGHAGGRTELPWLFLAGAGQHPGGGLSGASGMTAADGVLGAAAPAGRRAGRGAFGGAGAFAAGSRGGAVSRLRAEADGLRRGLAAYRTMRKGAPR